MKSREKIDEDMVKKINEEQKDWAATCPKCHVAIIGTLSELRGHICGK